ncbi:hypothetical protein FHS07_002947 [Microbacterium proteolyticum]|uniref:KAP NTPase domain-containing protein n=1 Tax=Microbacterium proteolyticum TaxID=1572644 RepID=A0A7W5CLR2_9MICO|nr:P-loop NTPase fold protein [Microbacterium proteolyticum]MBB3159229.1 hypothetical protein [Microbacterium proteolyticum]
MVRSLEDSWLSDDPLEQLDDELFGRSHLIDRAIDILARVRKQSTSTTVGLVGAWGSGKSSVLNGLASRLRDPDATTAGVLGHRWEVAEFNPWLFAGSTALYRGFFTAIRNALPKDDQWNDTKQTLVDIGYKLSPLASAAGLVGIDGQGAANAALDSIADDVVKTRDKVSAALSKLNQPILVVLDDLDRLTAEELLLVFKLVRLAGRLPNVYYLLSYDEHTLVDLLSHTDLVATDDRRRALDYLEKIVQVRIDMPLLRQFEVDRAVDRAIRYMAAKYDVRLAPGALQQIIDRFDAVLSKRLKSPRALKRVFGQVDAFLGSVGNEVDFGDYLVLTWLRTMEPGVYLLLQQRRSELLGVGGATLRDMDAPSRTPEQRRDDWLKALRSSHVAEDDADDILWLLGSLFDSIHRVYRLQDPEKSSGARPAPANGRIGHPEYFDRFFAFGVPADDLPDAVTDTALADVGAGDADSDAVLRVLQVFNEQPQLALSKLHRSVGLIEPASKEMFFWLRMLWMVADRNVARGRVENLAALVAAKMPVEQMQESVRELITDDSGLNYVAAVENSLSSDGYGSREVIEQRNRLGERIAPILNAGYTKRYGELARTNSSPLDLSQYAFDTVWYWRHQDPDGLRQFLASAASGSWPLLDKLAWLVPTASSDGETYFVWKDSSFGHYRELFDLGVVAQGLDEQIREAQAVEDFPEMEATSDVRRAWALAAVKQLLDRDAAARGTEEQTQP